MKIQSSTVAMASDYRYASSLYTASQTANTTQDVAATLTFSDEAKEGYAKQLMEQTKKDDSKDQSLQQMMDRIRESNENSDPVKFEEDPKITMLKRILEMLNGFKHGKRISFDANEFKERAKELRMECNSALSIGGQIQAFSVAGEGTAIRRANIWTRTTATDTYFGEAESVSFATTGKAFTEDGREISFNIEMAMSRSFYAEYHSYTQEDYIVTDPLVFNVGSDVAQISNQKFYFDLDCDGKEEKISFATGDSGFLALDKNGDGIINDGSELFGTKSGDGFKDLSACDEDGNGWIDENDSVFNRLKIWSKDENGKDKLMDIKSFGVGAIFLGSSNTEFHINDATTNKTNAVVRKTGFFLKENGGAGTVQHVDIAL